ncbi:MAG: BatA domain-containing protein [Planctomycetes bacterium]|nr:BatA domain-containing protein [Planctomycetota bacterium]
MSAFFGLFLNPLFLLAVPTAAIPVVLHLLHQRRAPVHHFSTLRFLKISHQKTARRKRIHDLLLLLLRALVLALLALGLAQPFLRSGASLLGGTAATEAVLVLDCSYSMGASAGGATRFGRARQAAEAVLGGLGPADSVSLLAAPAAGGRPTAATSPEEAREMLQSCRLSYGRADLGEALRQAAASLAASSRPNREMVLISDLQRNSWPSSPSIPGLDPGVHVFVIDCGEEAGFNAAVTDLRVRGERRAVGTPVTFEAHIRNFQPDRVRKTVSLYIDREKKADERIEIAAASEAVALFTFTFDTPGPHSGWVLLPEDDLETDNRRFFHLDVQPRLPVLLARDAVSAVPVLDHVFYLEKALDPFRGLGHPERSALQVDATILPGLDEHLLEKYPVLILAQCVEIPTGTDAAIRRFVDEGGGLMVFLGENLRPQAWNDFFAPAGARPWLGVRVASPSAGPAPSEARPQGLQEPDLALPLFQPFQQESRHLFRQVQIHHHVLLEVEVADGTQVLLRTAGGDPLLIQALCGRGKVFLWSVPATTAGSNLPVNNLFLPLLHRMVHGLTESRGRRHDFQVGQPVQMPFESGTVSPVVRVVTPGGATFEAPVTRDGRVQTFQFQPALEAGIHEVFTGGEAVPAAAFAVNVDSAESEFEPLSEPEIRRLIPARTLHVARTPEAVRDRIEKIRQGVQLWNFFFAAVLLLALSECFLANRQSADRSRLSLHPAVK